MKDLLEQLAKRIEQWMGDSTIPGLSLTNSEWVFTQALAIATMAWFFAFKEWWQLYGYQLVGRR